MDLSLKSSYDSSMQDLTDNFNNPDVWSTTINDEPDKKMFISSVNATSGIC